MRNFTFYFTVLCLLAISLVSAQITVSKTYGGPTVSVDGCGTYCVAMPGVTFTTADFPAGSIITDVNVSINWLKTDGTCAAPATGFSYHSETNFRINSPSSNVILATPNTWSGGVSSPTVTTVFDQSAATTPSGTPVNGTFLPNGGNLNNFNCENPFGNWVLWPGDTAGADPLCVNSYTVTITAVMGNTTAVCVPDFTLQLDAAGQASITAADIDNGSSSSCTPFSLSIDKSTFNCSDIGPNTITLTITDAAGNTDSCTTVVTVEDNIAPTALCVAPFTLPLDANGEASITPAMIDNGSTDNCGNVMLSFGFVQNGFNGDFAPANWSFNANGGNGSFAFGGSNESLTLTGSNNAGAGGNIDTELCVSTMFNGIIQFNWNYTTSDVDGPQYDPFGYSLNGTFVQLSNNAGGNSQSGVATINVAAGDQFCFVANTSDDCCGSATTVSNMFIFEGTSPSSFTCDDIGDHTILISVTDDSGNTSLCTTTVSIVDNIAPAITCVPNQTIDTDAGVCTYTHSGTAWDATATDNCSVASITYVLTGATTGTGTTLNGVVFNLGVTTLTWTATDGSDNTAVCSYTVTVEDNEAPIAMCVAPFTIQLDENGQASITAADINAGSTDNCGIATIEIDRTNFDCSDLAGGAGNNIVYALHPWSGTDNVYLYDFDPATLNLTFNSIAGSTNVFDNYGFDVSPVTGEYYLLAAAAGQRGIYTLDMNTFATTLVTTVTSTTGNLNAQDFAINNAGEFVILYQDGSVNKLDINTLATTFFATVSTPGGGVGFTYDYDNNRFLITNSYSPVTLSELTSAGVQNTLFTFFTPGSSGGCTAQAIEYAGNGKCIASSTFGCNVLYSIDLNAQSVSLIAQPNGSPDSNIKDLLLSPGNSNIHTVTLTVTDVNGNVSTCTTQVTVEDNIAPQITCVANQTVDTDAGLCSYTHSGTAWDATATDNCSIATTEYELSGATTGTGTTLDGVAFNLGITTVTWTATDGSSNTDDCSFTVTVEDNEAPQITCVANQTVDTDFNLCTYTHNGTAWDATATDNCSIATTEYELTGVTTGTGTTLDGVTFNLGVTTVTWTTTDGSGNTNDCSFTVTVEDNQAPQIVCPLDIVIDAEPGMCGAQVFFGNATALDACSGFLPTVQTAGPVSGSFFPVGDTVISFSATDAAGNVATCSFTITVEDNQAPLAVCQNITIQLDANGVATITAEDLNGGSTDNCGSPLTYTASQTTFDCSHVGDNTITLTVTDAAGNSSTCTAIVTVEDNIAPVANCAAPFTIQLDANGNASITEADIDNGSTDNCSGSTITLSQSTFTCADLGENTITLTITDASGNTATCTTVVTVEDTIAPIVSCIDFTLQLGPDGTALLTPEDIGGTSTDNCAITITAIDIEDFDCSDIGTPVLVTYFASDASGNIASCTAMVTVVDVLAPVIACPADFTVDTDQGSITYTLPDYFGEGLVTATDNCTDPVTIYSQTPAPGALLLDGTYTITLTATDQYGNEATCTFELTVDTILGAEDNRFDFSSLTMYPNPAEFTVTIGNPKFMAIDNIAIYDIQGRMVVSKNTQGATGNQTLDVSNLSSAVYMVIIQSQGKQTVKRLIRK